MTCLLLLVDDCFKLDKQYQRALIGPFYYHASQIEDPFKLRDESSILTRF